MLVSFSIASFSSIVGFERVCSESAVIIWVYVLGTLFDEAPYLWAASVFLAYMIAPV